MALSPLFEIQISSDITTGTIIDETVYGGANPARNTLRVFMKALKVAFDNTEENLPLTSNTGDPATVSQYTWSYTKDGYTKFYYVAIPAYSGGTTYAHYDAVYDGTNTVYRSKVAGNVGQSLSNTAYWELITDPAALAANVGTSSESLNITSYVYRRVLRPLSQQKYSQTIAANCVCTDCDEDNIVQQYNYFSVLLNGMAVADTQTEVVKGEVIARKIESSFLTNC